MKKEEPPVKDVDTIEQLQEKVRRKMMRGILQSSDVSDTQNLAKALLDFEQACTQRNVIPR